MFFPLSPPLPAADRRIARTPFEKIVRALESDKVFAHDGSIARRRQVYGTFAVDPILDVDFPDRISSR
jgi:hypothetical protein